MDYNSLTYWDRIYRDQISVLSSFAVAQFSILIWRWKTNKQSNVTD